MPTPKANGDRVSKPPQNDYDHAASSPTDKDASSEIVATTSRKLGYHDETINGDAGSDGNKTNDSIGNHRTSQFNKSGG